MIVKGKLYQRNVDEETLNSLTFHHTGYDGEVTEYKLYRKLGDDTYVLPRYTYGKIPADAEFDLVNIPIDIEFSEKINLNWSQMFTVRKTQEFLVSELGAIIVGKTGEGKTLMAIKLICMLKQKTLILVQKDSMIQDWTKELLALTNLKKNQIGLIKQGKVKDGLVVIGSQQSLMNNRIDNAVNNMFALKIQDEVHKIGAEKFLYANTRFDTKYVLAMSATPKREDGLDAMYEMFTSSNKVYHISVRTKLANYRVYQIATDTPRLKLPAYLDHREKCIRNVISDVERNKKIMNILYRHNHRHIVVISERVEHLKNLMELAEKTFPNKKIYRFFGEHVKRERIRVTLFKERFSLGGVHEIILNNGDRAKIDVISISKDRTKINKCIFIYDGSEYEKSNLLADDIWVDNGSLFRNESVVERVWKNKTIKLDEYEDPDLSVFNDADIIFATYKKMTDSTNIPHLDTILYASPFASLTTLVQSKGRVERYKKGKLHPLVIDLVDIKYQMFIRFYEKRKREYSRLGMKKLPITLKI